MRRMRIDNYRIVVEIPTHGGEASKYELREAEDVAAQIKRHCDVKRDAVSIEPTGEWICSHCGDEWTESDKSPHNGGCCDEDAKLMPEETP